MSKTANVGALVVALGLTASPALADVSVGVGLDISGDAEVKTSVYDCTGQDAPFTVQYLNADPNFLALVPVEGKVRVFANVIAGSGAKYESGQYVWWNKGAEAWLYDVTEGQDAAPVLSCTEHIDTP